MKDSCLGLVLVPLLVLCISAHVGKKKPNCAVVRCSFPTCPPGEVRIRKPNECCFSCVKTGPCRYGTDGNICGTETLKQCENAYTNCVVPVKPKYAEGKCCYNSKESNPCRYGDDGTICGTPFRPKCENPGTSCVGRSFAGTAGKCCFNGKKKGKCPALQGVGTCPVQCRFDTDCQGKKKCCFNGCGVVCSDPVY
ncbi:perlwapin-like [Dreissena polymorpha]|uniref:perlwapin-like n=1 Tax=Dreissena polymorpha TaxID=45954 RepID=UPI00226567FD|nr:perlwapin-like [Dreissena polymorpha]